MRVHTPQRAQPQEHFTTAAAAATADAATAAAKGVTSSAFDTAVNTTYIHHRYTWLRGRGNCILLGCCGLVGGKCGCLRDGDRGR